MIANRSVIMPYVFVRSATVWLIITQPTSWHSQLIICNVPLWFCVSDSPPFLILVSRVFLVTFFSFLIWTFSSFLFFFVYPFFLTLLLSFLLAVLLSKHFERFPVYEIFKASALWADAFYKSKCPSVCLSVCLSLCLSVCVFTFEAPFKHLFSPISQSRMSNIFRDSESLGKSNGKKRSQIWNF